MTEKSYYGFAAEFAQALTEKDFSTAYELLAPWLQAKMSENDFQTIIEDELNEVNEEWGVEQLIYPADFSISENSSTLDSLKETTSWREPRNISSEITEENFRKWMVIQFLPDEEDERIEFDAWFDFWFILVETKIGLKIGYFEIEDPD